MTMMLKYYALQDDPFSQTSHPAWFFASRGHTAALQTLRESLKAGEALALLLGEPGVGKTFLVHAALAHRDLQHLKLVHLWYPTCSFRETLQIIGWELGLDAVPDDAVQLTSALHRALLTEHEHGGQVVLVIDEAHTIPVESLASLVRLSHGRALTGVPLLQIVLVGLPALWHHFSTPLLRPFKHRTVPRVTLAPLTYGESLAYIRHRLQQAGAGDGTVFTPGAVRRVARHARGNPRVLNMLCTHMLLTGFAARQKPIAAPIAQDVITEYRSKRSYKRWWYGMTAAASILAVAGTLGGLVPSTSRILTARGPRGLVPLTRSLLAESGVETGQHPATTVSPSAVSTLSALPTLIAAASPPPSSTESPLLPVQGANLPEPPTFQTPPTTSPTTADVPQAVQPSVLLLETAPSAIPPVVRAQSMTPQALREAMMPFETAPHPRAPLTPPVITTRIMSPQHGARVAQKIAVEGVIAGLQPDQHVFVCVQSQAFGRRIYPQGKVRPAPTGQWTVESIYRSIGYRYATFLVSTTNTTSAALLSAPQSRKYGLHDLPPSTERLGSVIVVMRE
jgi:type II secretory pathway predicted ATPase ExeA